MRDYSTGHDSTAASIQIYSSVLLYFSSVCHINASYLGQQDLNRQFS